MESLEELGKKWNFTTKVTLQLQFLHLNLIRLRMAVGRGGAGLKDEVFVPVPYGYVLPHLRPTSHDGENFHTHPRPLGLHEASPHLIKIE